jgi:hypothetical protein
MMSVPSDNKTFLLRAFALDRLEGFPRRLIRRYVQPAKSDNPALRTLSRLNVVNAETYVQLPKPLKQYKEGEFNEEYLPYKTL